MEPLRSIVVALAVTMFSLTACAPQTAPPPPAPVAKAPLYQRLGGQPAITAVVDDFVANVAADTKINRFFAHTNIPHLKKELVDQICQATGGPCQYTGRSMRDAHHNMHVTDADFDALVGDLVKTLNKFKVPQAEQNELLGILGPLRAQIVNV